MYVYMYAHLFCTYASVSIVVLIHICIYISIGLRVCVFQCRLLLRISLVGVFVCEYVSVHAAVYVCVCARVWIDVGPQGRGQGPGRESHICVCVTRGPLRR